jgi:UDP:flavonoid glycosyltransferase YjiC (YdhE family)
LRAGGDEVVVAAAADAAPIVETSGADFFVAGNGEDVWFERLVARTRGNPGDGIAPERINHYFVPRLFGEIAAADMIDDVLACGRDLHPDLVLFENYALAGPLAAELLDVPGVNHLLGPMSDHEVWILANDALSPLWRSFDRDIPGYAGVYRDLTIEVCPPSLEVRRVPSGQTLTLRPAPLPDPAVARHAGVDATTGGPGPGHAERPLIYATLGTFFNSNLEFFRIVLDGLADEPVDIVITVGRDQDPAALGAVPPNVRVAQFIAQAELLPSCDAVIHHGGAGTTFGALAHGIPQVIVPQGADNFDNAAMCQRSGTAVVLHPGEVYSAAIAAAVRQVLDQPDFGAAARGAAGMIAQMPGPAEVADALRAHARR